MALRALLAQGIIVCIIFVMTTNTASVGTVKFMVLVTTLTQGNGMHTFKWKIRQLVVKIGCFSPLGWVMAKGAVFQLFVAVYAIGGVTTDTAARYLVIQFTPVALNTTQCLVFPEQGPARFLFMIEACFFPTIALVTTVAGLSMTPRMYVAGNVA